jgi:hypothetical protein
MEKERRGSWKAVVCSAHLLMNVYNQHVHATVIDTPHTPPPRGACLRFGRKDPLGSARPSRRRRLGIRMPDRIVDSVAIVA